MIISHKNWKIILLASLLFFILLSLGFWQLDRAKQKRSLLKNYQNRTHFTLTSAKELHASKDLRFFKVNVRGYFDNQHTFLLDNKIFRGQVGYEVYTLFHTLDGLTFLVDRGFVSAKGTRDKLPYIKKITAQITINGMLNMPPPSLAYGKMYQTITWPLRIEFLDISSLINLLNQKISPYIIMTSPDTSTYPIEWQLYTIGPEKHIAYAVQWFALAATLLVLFWALKRG